MSKVRNTFVWTISIIAIAVSVSAVARSPLLEYRSPVYIGASYAGVIAMSLLLFQPMLAAGYLSGLSGRRGRRVHQWVGTFLVLLIIAHVLGLWITSPPEFVSPTPFSVWGVIAMWAVFITACLAALRRRLHLRPRTWRWSHKTLAIVIVVGTVVHAMMIEGTMEIFSKTILCLLVVGATVLALAGHKFSGASP